METNEVIKYFENYLKASSFIGGGVSKQDKMFRKAITLFKRGEKAIKENIVLKEENKKLKKYKEHWEKDRAF